MTIVGIGVGLGFRRGAGGAFEFASGSLAGEMERLTESGDYTLTVDGESLPVEFIYHDGDVTYSENTNLGSATPDERGVCVRVRGKLTIDEAVTVTTAARKLGLYFLVHGDVTINGILDMTARGANHSASGSDIAPFDLLVIDGIGADGIVPSAGGAGGAEITVTSSDGNAGIAGSNGGTGGGGTGGRGGTGGTTAAGADGTGWSGGSASGGGASNGAAPAPEPRGGAGGNATSAGAGNRASAGGTGNPNGSSIEQGSGTVDAGTGGTGGLIVLIVLGTITVGATGIVRANGVRGGNATASTRATGGGGTGGGSVNLYRRGAYANNGTIQANGGAGGTATGDGVNQSGGSGGAGDIRAVEI